MLQRRSFLLLLTSAALPTAGHAAESMEFPEYVSRAQGQQLVDGAATFLEARHKAALQVIADFDLYLAAVVDQSIPVRPEWFALAGRLRRSEDRESTSSRLRSFMESAEATYLTAPDRQYLERHEERLRFAAEAQLEAVEAGARTKALPSGVSTARLLSVLNHASDAVGWFKSRSHIHIAGLLATVLAEIPEEDARNELPKMLRTFPYVQAVPSGDLDSTWREATFRALDTIRAKDPDARILTAMSWEIVGLLVGQSFLAMWRRQQLVKLATERINDLVGRPALHEFQTRLGMAAFAIRIR